MEFSSDEVGFKVSSGLFRRQVLTAGTLVAAKTIRIEPALNVPYEILDEVMNRLEETLKDVQKSQ
jgi:putrescine aminotransferase